ncbi:phage tail assembly chaperone [Novosphingobium sp.]|uniref:phage tail assembly chaperone n=1 Tax=Novosphingobium sp. TaxID=1874826 RepID=UPI002614803F|nr:phage tail assembly chaperone [Novosphingobium sp.]
MSAKAEARFGEVAARLAGQAALLIGWTPDTFWAATPEELAAIVTAAAPPPAGGMDKATITAMMERDAHG